MLHGSIARLAPVMLVTCAAAASLSPANASANGEATMTPNRIELDAGHFRLAADASRNGVSVTAEGGSQECADALDLEQSAKRIKVRIHPARCAKTMVTTIVLGNDWLGGIDIALRSGQIDIDPSLMRLHPGIQARVSFGDIVGHRHSRRSGIIGASLNLDRGDQGPTLAIRIRSGQLTLPSPGR